MSEVPVHSVWHALYRKRWTVLLTGLTAGVAAYVFGSVTTPMYEAKTTLFLASTAEQARYVSEGGSPPPGPLFPIPEEKASALDVGMIRGGEIMGRLAERFDQPRGLLARRIDVVPSSEYMINVFVRDEDPARAAQIANAVPEIYEAFHEGSMRQRSLGVAEALEAEVARLSARQDKLEGERQELRTALGAFDTDEAAGRLEQSRDFARQELASLNVQIAATEARISKLEEALEEESRLYERGETYSAGAALESMRQTVLSLRVDLASITDGPGSPRRLAIENQIAEIEEAIADEVARVSVSATKSDGSVHESLRRDLLNDRAELAGLEAAATRQMTALDQAEARYVQALRRQAEAEEIKRGLADVRALIATARTNLAEARLQAENAEAPIVVTERAEPPTRPVYPLVVLNTIVAVICGLILGIYYVLFMVASEKGRARRRAEASDAPLFTDAEIERLRALVPAAAWKSA